jgi:hypothetical protein
MSDLKAPEAMEIAKKLIPGDSYELIAIRWEVAKALVTAYYDGSRDGFREGFEISFPKEVSHVN